MASLFVKEKLVDPYIIAIDSTLLKAKGHLWHKSSMIKGAVPRSGIDKLSINLFIYESCPSDEKIEDVLFMQIHALLHN
jgi:hypothetical protein